MSTNSDNPSYTKILTNIEGFKLILTILPGNNDELKNQLSSIEKQINNMRFDSDKFNQYYSERGWIAYESMNSDLMKNAVILAENHNCDKGEELLIDYYTNNDSVRFQLSWLKNRNGFKKRYELLLKAFEDFMNKRYHSCIPVFLMIIDGVVDEVTKSNKGFFASDFNPQLWNSIVGHESGLSKIAKIYAKTRKKVNTDPISLPYRNGILHGKDINYDNVKVAAKCLATVFAVGDWVYQYESGKHIKPEPSTPKTIFQQFKELKVTFDSYLKQREEIARQEAEIKKWKPRVISEDYIKGLTTTEKAYEIDSPEQKVSEFMNYFTKKNYGMLHDVIAWNIADKNKGQNIQTIKSFVGNLSLKGYQIVSIKDCSPAISEIEVQLNIIDDTKKVLFLNTKCRLIYQKDGFGKNVLVRGNPQGQWFVMEFFINEIYNQYWSAQISCKEND